jgi:hypothetical protein
MGECKGLNTGVAASWKLAETNKYFKNGFPTFENLKKTILMAFSPIDNEGVAKTELHVLKQGEKQIKEYIAEFSVVANRTNITEDTALVEYFINGLHPKLLERVFTMESPPTTLQGWKKAASKFNGNYRRAHAIAQHIKGGTISRSYESTSSIPVMNSTPTRNPNTMDVDHLTQQE